MSISISVAIGDGTETRSKAFRIIEISKYDDGGQLTTRGQLMQGSSTVNASDTLCSNQHTGVINVRRH